DYCNGALTGFLKQAVRQLQLIQNTVLEFTTRTRRRAHITPILKSLHWLPVNFHIDFKILLLVFKALHGLAPRYILEMLSSHQPIRPLRSSCTIFLTGTV
ncbi:hypothetical protein LDENG_00086950, partial [Lucifuga dentata]